MPKEDTLELRWILSVIRRWLWLIVVCTLLATTTAFLVSSWMRPIYTASATLLVRQTPSTGMSDYNAILASQQLANTYARMLSGRPVMEAVIALLRLGETPDVLVKRVKVDLIRDTQLIRLSVEHTNPAAAALIANTIAETFITQNAKLEEGQYADLLANTKQQMDELSAQIESTQAQIDALDTPKTVQEQAEMARLQAVVAGYRSTQAMLLQNYGQMRLTAAQSEHNVIITEPARAPERPIQRRTLYTSLAAVVSLMLGVGIAFLLENLDDTIKTSDDVSQMLGLDTLGTIGRLAGWEEELVVTAQPDSPVAEAFRVLSTNLRFSSVGKPLRTFLVTSPGLAEGKSITVANLAAAMALTGIRVVAVDADLRHPRLHQLFGLDLRERHTGECASWGLTGALLEGCTNGSLQPAQVDGLSVLPSGELPPNPAELAGSQNMRELLEKLLQQADVLLIDSPPVLPVVDAKALAQVVDGVLLVVKVGHTRREAAQDAVESLRQVKANLVGVVLNISPKDKGRRYYYTKYGKNRSRSQDRHLRQ